MYVESGNDQDADKKYSVIATQADFDRFTMKVPDSGCVERHACMAKHTDIGRASRYEQKSHRSETTGAICEYRRRLRECEARSNRLSCMVVSASADIAV